MTDLPTTFVSVTRDGKTKRVEDYVAAPEGLRELERQIDAAAGTRRWTRIDEPTLRQLVAGGRAPSAGERAEMFSKALSHDDVDVIRTLLEDGSALDAARKGKAAEELGNRCPSLGSPRFRVDFDAVIAVLEAAMSKKR